MIKANSNIFPVVMDLSPWIDIIDRYGISGSVIQDILTAAQPRRIFIKDVYDWYMGNGDPILNRVYEIDGVRVENKINNKVTHDYLGRIVNTKTGYLFGEDTAITLNKDKYRSKTAILKRDREDPKYLNDTQVVQDFRTSANLSDQDVELGKYAAICGYAGRLMWYDAKNNAHSLIVAPWDCLFITAGEVYDAPYALRIYESYDVSEDITSTIVEFYDSRYRYIFKSDSTTTTTTVGGYSLTEEPEPHGFDGVPFIGYANNREIQGEGEKVLNKILDYSRTVSDLSSEFEQLRLAYMIIDNIDVDDKEIQKMKQTGALKIRTTGTHKAGVYFLTKQIDAGAINQHLDRLNQDILADSGTVDFTNPKLYTSLSSTAMKMRVMQLENRSKTTESKFRAANREMWKIVTDFWKRTGRADIDYLAIVEIWRRNLPVNELEAAQTLATIQGRVSDLTAFSSSIFVEDPEQEIRRLQEQGVGPFEDE